MIKNIRLLILFLALCGLNLWSCGENAEDPARSGFPNGGSTSGVSAAVISVDQSDYTGNCPHTFKLSGLITMSAPGFFTYWWEDLTHLKSFGKSHVFLNADSVELSGELTLRSNSSVEVVLYIEGPITFDSAPLKVTPSKFVSTPVRITVTCE